MYLLENLEIATSAPKPLTTTKPVDPDNERMFQ